MKTIFKAVQMTKAAIELTLSFKARVTNASGTSLFAMAAADIPALGIRLISNGISGFADLIASGAAVVSGNGAVVTLANLPAGVHRLLVVAQYGTNTRSLLAIDITVPASLAEGTQEIAENVIVIETIGDGAEETIVDDELSNSSTNPVQNKVVTAALAGKADGSVYDNGADDTAFIGRTLAVDGSIITSGCVTDGLKSVATGVESVTDGEASHAMGDHVVARNGQFVCGRYNVDDTDDAFQFIVGNGEDTQLSNAFAVAKLGGLALFKADGTPVMLSADELTALKALLNQ